MTPAEFKTLRESLWLSQQDIAGLAKVQKRTVQYWEDGSRPRGVPEDIAELLKRLDALVEATILRIIDSFLSLEDKPDNIIFLRFKTDRDLQKYRPQDFAAFGTVKVHSAMLDRTRTALARLGHDARFTFMEPVQYEKWLADEELVDHEQTRAAWAGLQV
ncbi:helix-turn-helix domain-containing protein [Kiloniella laminariae]|uniref:helix-turn-helix domain-containing protein n=1 Tax=Kiloniella laminariae TaxID=454162 RepID=UPI00036AAABE|nr:hypothetical protein [Kiloniella laminariae]